MRHTDLELYRWKYHHDVYLPSNKNRAKYFKNSLPQWWSEHAAFISTLPRQVGKSGMLATLIAHLTERMEDYLVVVPNLNMQKIFLQNTGVSRQFVIPATSMYDRCFDGVAANKINLLIDEYQWLDKPRIISLLDYDWKTVTMAGTLRL